MKIEHTPGPWIAVGALVEHPNDRIADICNCDPIAMSQGHIGRSYDEQFANARLISAAPELLDVVKGILEEVKNSKTGKYDISDDSYVKAIGAINKVEGRRI